MPNDSAAALLGGSPAPAPAAAPAAPAAPAAAPAAPAAPAVPQFFDAFENAEVKTWVSAKGFKDPAALAESAWNLEKLIGHERAGRTLVVPKDDAPADEWKAFSQKLGVPETPDGYKLPVPQGADPAFSQQAAKWMHEAGIPPRQASILAEKWNEFATQTEAQAIEQMKATSAREVGEVLAEWGDKADANKELASRAVQQFIPAKDAAERQEMLSKIEAAIGTKAMMKMFATIGSGLGEGRVVDAGGGGSSFGMSPAQAQAKIKALQSDNEWAKAYVNGDPAKKAEFEQLFAVAYPATGG